MEVMFMRLMSRRTRETNPIVRSAVTVCFCLLGVADAVRADVIELKTGQKIEGEVLKERPDELVVDIQIDIIRIPTAQIKTRTTTAKTQQPADVKQEELYSTADL